MKEPNRGHHLEIILSNNGPNGGLDYWEFGEFHVFLFILGMIFGFLSGRLLNGWRLSLLSQDFSILGFGLEK